MHLDPAFLGAISGGTTERSVLKTYIAVGIGLVTFLFCGDSGTSVKKPHFRIKSPLRWYSLLEQRIWWEDWARFTLVI